MFNSRNLERWCGMCLSSLSITMRNANQKQPGKERVYFNSYLSGHIPSLREVRARTWRQDLKQRPLRSATNWLAPHDCLSLCLQPRTTCAGCPPHHGLDSPPSISNQTVAQLMLHFPKCLCFVSSRQKLTDTLSLDGPGTKNCTGELGMGIFPQLRLGPLTWCWGSLSVELCVR